MDGCYPRTPPKRQTPPPTRRSSLPLFHQLLRFIFPLPFFSANSLAAGHLGLKSSRLFHREWPRIICSHRVRNLASLRAGQGREGETQRPPSTEKQTSNREGEGNRGRWGRNCLLPFSQKNIYKAPLGFIIFSLSLLCEDCLQLENLAIDFKRRLN